MTDSQNTPAPSKPGFHSLTITRGAAQLLQGALVQPGWAKTPNLMYQGGKLVDRLDKQFSEDKAPNPGTEEAGFRTWADREVAFEVSEKERDAIKTCLKEQVKEGRFSPTKHYVSLALAVGIIED